MGSREWNLKSYSNVSFYSGLNRSGRFILCAQDIEHGQLKGRLLKSEDK